MLIAFILTMPGVNTWNNKWSGKSKLYVKIRKVSKIEGIKILKNSKYDYDFKDGWMARINVSQVDYIEAAKLRRQSLGFLGYEWMIQSIINNGEIKST